MTNRNTLQHLAFRVPALLNWKAIGRNFYLGQGKRLRAVSFVLLVFIASVGLGFEDFLAAKEPKRIPAIASRAGSETGESGMPTRGLLARTGMVRKFSSTAQIPPIEC